MKKIAMRISKKLACEICGESKENVLELFDLKLGNKVVTLCDDCVQQVLSKTLKANVEVNSKLKTKHDLAILKKRKERIKIGTSNISVNEALSSVDVPKESRG